MADPADSGASPGPTPCGPCRGTGVVISGAGGAPHERPCPWCEGTGTRIEGHDAQAARRGAEGEDASGPSPEVD